MAAQRARRAADEGADLVIAAGGDGTVRAAAEGLVDSQTTLGILPRGTMNVLARALGIALDDWRAACDLCLDGHTRQIDLGRIDVGSGDADAPSSTRAHFLLMCSVGLDAAAVAGVNTDVKGVVGAPAYVLSGLATLAGYTPTHLTLTLDGEAYSVPAFMAVIANVASYGGDFQIAPHATLDDGLLDVCVFEAPAGPPPVQKASFLRQMGAMALSRHLIDPDVSYFRARRVEIVSAPEAPVQIDGDALGRTSVVVDVLPRALRVRAPNGL